MVVTVAYFATAILLAPVIFVAAEWVGNDGGPRPPHQVAYSFVAAALWPLLVVGLAQFAAIAAVRHVLVSHSAGSDHSTPEQTDGEAENAKPPRVVVPYVRVQMGTAAH